MLINLSNHPSPKWQPQQLNAANKEFGEIHDLEFPIVDPTLNSDETQKLVAICLQTILQLHPIAVHVMGEMTFTCKLVTLLKQHKIRAIASTTDRTTKIDEDGNKTSSFQFVQFREY